MAEKVNMPSQRKEKKKKRKKKLPSDFYDYNLLACTILLVSFGLIMLYSASAYEAASTFKGNDMYYFTHQAGLSAIVPVHDDGKREKHPSAGAPDTGKTRAA